MKNIILSLLAILFVLSGCSQEKSQVEEKEVVVEKQDSSDADPNQPENEEVSTEEEEASQPSDNTYSIQLDDRLEGQVVLEKDPSSDKRAYIYYMDQTLLNDKIIIGTIDSGSSDSIKSSIDEGVLTLVNYEGGENNPKYMYTANMEDPYLEHYQINEDGDAYLPLEEAINYSRAKELVHTSLLNSNFMYGSIMVNQIVPEQIDANGEAGLQISRAYLEDIQAWYERLNSAANSGSTEEFFTARAEVGNEVIDKYPELRQIPFPTQEIGYNISTSIQALSYWSYEDYEKDAEVKYLSEVNLVKGIGQFVEVIQEQLAELENI
ncbi:hypothetical protein [Mesobacillus selenatarsenatis]|uniref:Lipoprotein n=1 Tax=Mesobacillus selenatarsenatis (strain DSM 18680 / JCM 14380 / FERM P-15431 / SF-1) TaxID=1321606 RepID=A0A0A8X8P6_MESS1|nr:hypothetical protein [Mesobacillus selenatarsenatis]GAM16288.1 hypothetical protein SAMD00020551_4476 [Mesobacillus selenatarsenatis SF-1]